MGSTYFWLDPQTGECHWAPTHAQWLVANAERLGLQRALADLDPQRAADAIQLVGMHAGLIRITDDGQKLSVLFHAEPACVQKVVSTVLEFLREHEQPPTKTIDLRNCRNGREKILAIGEFIEIVDSGGNVYSRLPAASNVLQSLVVGHLVLISFWWVSERPTRRSLGIEIFLALLFSQITLLAVWLSQISRNNWVAWFFAVGALGYLFTLVWRVTGSREVGVMGAIGCGTFAVALLVMMALRFLNFRIASVSSDDSIPASSPLQFSIRQIMIVTAICAVLFMIFRNVSKHPNGADIIFLALWFAAPPLLATWATLTTGRLWLRIAIALGIALLGSRASALFLEWLGGSLDRFYATVALLEGLISVATLLVVRRRGFRLLRLGRTTE